MTLFSEFKTDPKKQSDFLFGYRCTFSEGVMTGMLTSGWKGTAIYRKPINEMMQMTFTGTQDFASAKSPTQFGVSFSFGGM